MEITIKNSVILWLGISAALLAVLPILPAAVWKVRCGRRASWKYLLAGALGFFVSVRVLELAVHMVCIVLDNPVSRFINGHTAAYVLYGITMAGVFEECGRYVILRFLMKRDRTRENAVFYGIGHGGIEVWLITLMAVISYLAAALMLRSGGVEQVLAAMGATAETRESFLAVFAAVAGYGGANAFWTVLERVLCMVVHTALTVVVFHSVESGKTRYLLYAALAHMGVDVMAALTQRGVVGVLASTLWLAVWAAGLAAWAVRLYRVQREQ